MIDTTTEFGKRAERRLHDEIIGWLTTVTPGGQPQSVPIWFLWQDDETILMFSQPNRPKLRNIRNNPHVSFNFDSDGTGSNIVRLEGRAEIVEDAPPANEVPAFLEKYRERIPNIDMTADSFAENYPVPVIMTPAKLRGF